MPAKVWKRHWNVDCRPAGSGENALRYLSRYVFKTATSNRTLPLGSEGKVRWNYRESKTGQHTSIQLEPLEFMGRFLQHILPPDFARVRTFGWLHPAAKVRANRVRALLREKPLLTPAEQKTWQPPPDPDLEPPPRSQPSTLQPATHSVSVVSTGHAAGGLVASRPGHALSQTTAMKAPCRQSLLRPRRVPSSTGGLCPEAGFSRQWQPVRRPKTWKPQTHHDGGAQSDSITGCRSQPTPRRIPAEENKPQEKTSRRKTVRTFDAASFNPGMQLT